MHEEQGGWFGNKIYDKVQRNIRFNHLSIVDSGRAGQRVTLVYNEVDNMKLFEWLKGKELSDKERDIINSAAEIAKKNMGDHDEEKSNKDDKMYENMKHMFENMKKMHEDMKNMMKKKNDDDEMMDKKKNEDEDEKKNGFDFLNQLKRTRKEILDEVRNDMSLRLDVAEKCRAILGTEFNPAEGAETENIVNSVSKHCNSIGIKPGFLKDYSPEKLLSVLDFAYHAHQKGILNEMNLIKQEKPEQIKSWASL